MMNQLTMFVQQGQKAQQMADDICAGRHGQTRESVEANPTSLKKGTDRGEIYRLTARRGRQGLTLDEACEIMGVAANCISGRFTELVEVGALFKSGYCRQTRMGKRAAVYLAVPVEARLPR